MGNSKLKEILKGHDDLHDEIMLLFKNDEEESLLWLTKSKLPLCNETPLSLIGSKEGKEKVIDMIYRIRTGDLS